MVATQPNDLPPSESLQTMTSSFEPLAASIATFGQDKKVVSADVAANDFYSSHQAIDDVVLQDIEERFVKPPTVMEKPHMQHSYVTDDISPPCSPNDNNNMLSMPGVVDISPPHSREDISPPDSPVCRKPGTIPLVGSDGEGKLKSDDDFALDLIEDITLTKEVPRRATLVSIRHCALTPLPSSCASQYAIGQVNRLVSLHFVSSPL